MTAVLAVAACAILAVAAVLAACAVLAVAAVPAAVAGAVLYKVLWVGFPPDIATWEKEEEDIPCGERDFVEEFEVGLAEDEAGEGAEEF